MGEFITYAQNFEDVMLWRALRDVDQGFYIDVGAADPDLDSVTKAFYDAGWHGLNIEPYADLFSKLAASRPRDINLDCVVGETAGSVDYYKVIGTGLSTTNSDLARRHAESGYAIEVIKAPQRTLADICEQYAPRVIYFLKVDAEGAEAQVILGADFNNFRPWTIIIEATEPNSSVENWQDWEPLLLASRYTFAWFDGLNRFYLADERVPVLAQAFRAPPNVFDRWRRPTSIADQATVARWQTRVEAAERERDNAVNACLTATNRLAGTQAALAASRKDLSAAHESLETVQNALAVAQDELADTKHALAQQEAHLSAFLGSTSWKISKPVRKAVTSLRLQLTRTSLVCRALLPGGVHQRAVLKQSLCRRFSPPAVEPTAPELPGYQEWVTRFDTLRPNERNEIRHRPVDSELPKILGLICVGSGTWSDVMDTIVSLRGQLRDNWQALVCCGTDCSAELRNDLQSYL